MTAHTQRTGQMPPEAGIRRPHLAVVPTAPRVRRSPLTDLAPASLAAWHDWRRYATVRGFSPRTLSSYGDALAQLSQFLGGAEILAATRDDLRRYYAWLMGTVSVGTVVARQRALHAWFAWAARPADHEKGGGELISANPCAGIPLAKGQRRVVEVLSEADLRALLRTCERKEANAGQEFARVRDAAMLSVWCEAGSPRKSEMHALAVEDVNLANDTLLIRHGKGDKRRQIVLSANTGTRMSRYLRAREQFARTHHITSDALWLGQCGALTLSALPQMLRRRAAQAGLGHIHPHQLRHTAYSRAEEAGMLPNDAMVLFGWSSETMTRIYGASARARRAEIRARQIQLGNL